MEPLRGLSSRAHLGHYNPEGGGGLKDLDGTYIYTKF